MEQILACPTSFIGHFLVRGDNGVADRTLRLTFQGTGDILAKDGEAVGY